MIGQTLSHFELVLNPSLAKRATRAPRTTKKSQIVIPNEVRNLYSWRISRFLLALLVRMTSYRHSSGSLGWEMSSVRRNQR